MAGILDIVAGFVSGLGDTAVKIRTAITGIDPSKQAEVQELLATLEAQASKAQTDLQAAQIDVNKVEAASTSKWVAGWRPYIGWIAGTVIGAVYIPHAFVAAGMWVRQVIITGTMVDYPSFNLTDLFGILGTLLGAGWNAYLRTQEKQNGVAQKPG